MEEKKLKVESLIESKESFGVDTNTPKLSLAGIKRNASRKSGGVEIDLLCFTEFHGVGEGNPSFGLGQYDLIFGDKRVKEAVRFKYPKGIPFFGGRRINRAIITVPDEAIDLSGLAPKQEISIDLGELGRGEIFFDRRDGNKGRSRTGKSILLDKDHALKMTQGDCNGIDLVVSENINAPVIINITKTIEEKDGFLTVKGWVLTKLLNSNGARFDRDKIELFYSEGKRAQLDFAWKNGIPIIKGYSLNRYKIGIPSDDILSLDIQNKLVTSYEGRESAGRIIYTVLDYKTGKNRNSRIFNRDGMSYYFRQTLKNTMYLTVREENYFDRDEVKDLVDKAYKEAKTMDSNFVLMYEKECAGYEESASVLYEKLIDLGYKNVFYILEKDHPARDNMPEKYKANLIYKHSYEHIKRFFACKTFVGTETIGHAIQLRAANKKIADKINDHDISFVFLQHGVMYMVSLSADLRSGFLQSGIKKHRVVVSSEKEAQHFIDLGGFKKKNLYITGLAKFDRSYRYDDADKIVIMPTWRRWEANQARMNFSETGYYKMIKKIADKVPEELKDKLIILPHPLMRQAMVENYTDLDEYLVEGKTNDEILRECRLLITDYSSISYDAFYRGTNIIFYWEEKEKCMANYGTAAFLLLNDENAFGDICYDDRNLTQVIKRNYEEGQLPEYIKKYEEIVTFHDNCNSDRIVEKLREDGII